MTSLAFLDLTTVLGPNLGMRYSIPDGMFRIIGRYEPGFIADERLLNPEQQELLLKHLPYDSPHERGPDILLDDPVLNTAQGLVLFSGDRRLWIDLLNEESKTIEIGDFISLGNTKLKVS